MNPRSLLTKSALAVLLVACGPGGGTQDGGADASSDATSGDASADAHPNDAATNDASTSDASTNDASDAQVDGNVSSADCLAQVDAVIDGGCTRCWPAGRAMCTQGNPGALVGMLHCLTNGSCWDEGDYNTAGPCMQSVIAQYGDSNVQAIYTKVASLNCGDTELPLTLEAIAAELSAADRATFATCVAQINSCASEQPLDDCLAQTHYDTSLCQN